MKHVYQSKLESFIPRHQLDRILTAKAFSEIIYSTPNYSLRKNKGWKQ